MKKITTIATALLLGGFGFSASAQVTSIVPTVDPESGSALTKLPDVTVNWDNAPISISPNAPGYFGDWGPEFAEFEVSLYVNGEQVTSEPTIGRLEDNNLTFNFTGNASTLGVKPYTVEFVVPEGAIIINSNEINSELKITYEIESDGPTGDVIGNGDPVPTDGSYFTIINGGYATVTLPASGTLYAAVSPGLFVWDGETMYTMLYEGFNTNLEEGENPLPITLITIDGSNAKEVSWQVEGGKTYYFYNNYWEPLTFSLSLDEAGGSGDIIPIIKIGEKYEGLSSTNPLNAQFTTDEIGVLTVIQTNSSDSHLFADAEHKQPIYPEGYNEKGNIFTMTFNLDKGETVYFYGPDGQYDDLSAVEFKWEAVNINADEIKEGVPFKAFDKIMAYTPEKDGMLTISATTYYQFNWASPAGTGLLFSDYALNNKVELQFVGSDADMDIIPTKYSTPVTGGETYYLYNVAAEDCEFTFTLNELSGVTLVDVVPEPGKAFDFEGDYGAGVILTFDPAQVSFDSAWITYTPKGGEETTVELKNQEGQVGENAQYEYKVGFWTFQAVSLYFAKAEKGTDLTLTLNNVNYNGIELTSSALNSSAVKVQDGNLSITWSRPAVDMAVVDQTWPETIYSNSEKGDKAMIATVTFNENIASNPSASLVFGSQYWGAPSSGDIPDPGMELPCTVEGATLTVDLSGIDFGDLYKKGAKEYNKVTIFVGNIIGEDGQKYIGQNPGIAKTINYVNEPAPAPEPGVTYLPSPVVNPEPGSILFAWTQNIVLQWDGILEEGEDMTVKICYNGGEPQELKADLLVMGDWSEDGNDYIYTGPSLLSIDWDSIGLVDWVIQPGKYDFEIPEGVVKDAEGNVNEACSLSYSLYAAKGWQEIIPDPFAMDENWETVAYPASALSEVTVTFDYDLELVEPQLPVACMLQSNDEEGGISPLVAENGLLDPDLIKVEGNAIVLDLSGLADGTWFIEIPAGFAKIVGLDDTYTNIVEFSYIIKDGLGHPEVIAGLEDNGTYTNLTLPEYAIVTWNYSNIQLTGEEVVTVEIEDMNNYSAPVTTIELPASALTLRYIEPGQEGGEPEPLTRAEEGVYNALEINFGEYLPEIENASWVALVLPEGLVTDGGFVNDKAYITINVYPVYQGEATFVNVDGVVSIFWGENEVGVNWDVDPAFITDTEGNVRELVYGSPFDEDVVPEITEKINEDWMFEGLEVYLNNLDLEDGNYTLWIPMGYVTIYPEDYSSMWVNNTAYWMFEVKDGMIIEQTTGIGSIETAAPAIEGVYNLQGVKMSNDLNSLAPGLYIINGKKVLIRK